MDSPHNISVRRVWSKGSKIIFLRKMAFTDFEDVFIGLGTIEKNL